MKSMRNMAERAVVSERPAPARGAQLLDALEEIFLREGFRRVTIGNLAARLHCSRQTLYQLAATKEALFLLTLDRFLSRIRDRGTAAANARSDIRERIVALVEPGVSELRRASSLFFADVTSFLAAQRLLEQHQITRRQHAQALIEEGIRKGTFRRFNSHLAAEIIVAAVQRTMDPSFLMEVGLSPSDAVREAEEMLLYGLLHLDTRTARAAAPTSRTKRRR